MFLIIVFDLVYCYFSLFSFLFYCYFFFQAEDGIRDLYVTGVQTCALPIYCRDAVFILMSTNKVYGDSPNEIPLQELETRYDYVRPEDYSGISESCRIDQTRSEERRVGKECRIVVCG